MLRHVSVALGQLCHTQEYSNMEGLVLLPRLVDWNHWSNLSFSVDLIHVGPEAWNFTLVWVPNSNLSKPNVADRCCISLSRSVQYFSMWPACVRAFWRFFLYTCHKHSRTKQGAVRLELEPMASAPTEFQIREAYAHAHECCITPPMFWSEWALRGGNTLSSRRIWTKSRSRRV